MTKPTLAPQAHDQRKILDLLCDHPRAIVTLEEITRHLYGDVNLSTRNNARQIVAGMRRRHPGLEIERVLGYRLRRPL